MSNEQKLAQLFQALADPTRIRLVRMIADGEACATDLHSALRMSQPRIARHLKILVDSGILLSRRDGRFVRYVLPAGTLAASVIREMLADAEGPGPPARSAPAPSRSTRAPEPPPAASAPREPAAPEPVERDDRPDDRLEDFLL